MLAHIVDIKVTVQDGLRFVHWRCSCGKTGPTLIVDHMRLVGRTSAERRARGGGARHVAAMDKR